MGWPADEWNGEPRCDQDRANVAPVGLQRAAVSTVVAEVRSLLARRARARDVFEVQVASPDEFA